MITGPRVMSRAMPNRLQPTLIAATMLLVALMAIRPALAADKVMVSDPWVREAPPNMSMHAAYAVLHNKSKAPVDLVSAKSPAYRMVELHLSKIEAGMATMVKQDQITIPASGMVKLSPGSFHFMLMHPRRTVSAGDRIEIIMGFADGKSQSFQAKVKKGGGMSDMKHHHGH